MSNQSENSVKGEKRTASVFLMQAAFLFAVWLLISGKFDLFHMGSGVFAVLLVLWLDRKLGPANLGKDDLPVRVHPVRLLLYIPWLMWQMLLSSLQVARIILNPATPMNPVLVTFRSRQPHSIARVLLGNSITLTPGTLTLNIEGDRYLVHALSRGSLEGLLEGSMPKKVARLFYAEGKDPVFDVTVGVRQTGGGIRS